MSADTADANRPGDWLNGGCMMYSPRIQAAASIPLLAT